MPVRINMKSGSFASQFDVILGEIFPSSLVIPKRENMGGPFPFTMSNCFKFAIHLLQRRLPVWQVGYLKLHQSFSEVGDLLKNDFK